MPSPYASKPTSSFGYWRGAGAEGPQLGGQGSGYGPRQQGAGFFAQGVGPPGATGGGWTPTVTYLIVFVVAEIIAFGILGRFLSKVKIP
jgi:hypothetical protein